jgi:short-subunit dehydrogenase
VVTGASRGIGAALAREFADRGARLTLLARSEGDVKAVAAEVDGAPLPVDLSAPAELHGLVDRIEELSGPVDLLVHNAALGEVAEFRLQAPGSVAAHVNTNLLAPMEVCHQYLPRALARGAGGIVTISSLSSEISIRNMASYVGTKAGLTSFTLTLQRELRATPVRTLLVILGEERTQMVETGRNDQVLAAIADRIGSMGSMEPEFVARNVVTAVERDKRTLVLPRAAWPLFGLRQLPNRLFDLAIRGI